MPARTATEAAGCGPRSLLQQLAERHPCTALAARTGPDGQPAERYVLVSEHAWSPTDRRARLPGLWPAALSQVGSKSFLRPRACQD